MTKTRMYMAIGLAVTLIVILALAFAMPAGAAWDDIRVYMASVLNNITSSTDNAIVRWDGTTGHTVQNSVATIADTTGNMAGVGTLSCGAITSTGMLTLGVDTAPGGANVAGSLKLFSAGDNAFYSTLTANTNTSNAAFILPADEPGAESWLTMGTDGVIDYTAISTETLATVTGRGATTTTASSFNGMNAAGGSANSLSVIGTIGIMDGTDTYNGLLIDLVNANHTGAGNVLNGYYIDSITGDAEATETGIKINSGGWDWPIDVRSSASNTDHTAFKITSDYQPTTGQTGTTESIDFYLTGTADSGGTYAENIAARIYTYKTADWFGASTSDHDAGIRFAGVSNGVLAANPIQINELSDIGVSNSNWIIYASGQAKMNYYTYGAATATNSANAVAYGNDAIIIEGTTADADELKINHPLYSDGGAGDQGGVADPTVTMVTASAVAETIADNTVGASPATATLDPYQWASIRVYTCNDADTCDVTLAETSSTGGQRITITNTTVNTVDLADQAGILEIAGGAVALATNDTISLIYTGSIWIETGRSDN